MMDPVDRVMESMTISTGELMNEVNSLTKERDKYKAALESLTESIEGWNQIIGQAVGMAKEMETEINRLTVELAHRVGWEERALKAEAEVERLGRDLEGMYEHDREQSAEIERLNVADKYAHKTVDRLDAEIARLKDENAELRVYKENYQELRGEA